MRKPKLEQIMTTLCCGSLCRPDDDGLCRARDFETEAKKILALLNDTASPAPEIRATAGNDSLV